MYIDHRKEMEKLTFRALALRQSSDEGLTLETSAVRWSIYITNSVDKPNFHLE